MSIILAEVNAGANESLDAIIRTLELISDAWTESVFICAGFEDITSVLGLRRAMPDKYR